VRLSGGQAVLGLAGVFVFFTISGYLVTGSYLASPSPLRFAAKRALRILPGLWLNLLVLGLLIGPMVTSLPLHRYLADPALLAFFRNNLLFSAMDTPLPGVVFSSNEVAAIVNAPLWTLRYEIMMYAMVLLLGLAGLLRLWVGLLLVAVGIAGIALEVPLTPYGDLGEWAWLVGFFATGMVMRCLDPARVDRMPLALAALTGLAVSLYLHMFIPLFPLFGSYLTIYLGRRRNCLLAPLSRAGDLSYGLYIYGWPIEQLVMWAGGGRLAWWQIFALSLAIAVPVAFFSWHGLEKRALGLIRRRIAVAPVPA
jgi:peptidoglycan/LPS O-acetylase OafA/YrhL